MQAPSISEGRLADRIALHPETSPSGAYSCCSAGINGRETYEEIIKIRPGQKAIIASGYAKTQEVDRAQELGAGKYIKKPYTLEKMGLAVKEELKK